MNKERDVIGEVIAEDNARPIHPAVAEYAVAALHTATSDGERVAELELLNKELWRQNAQRDARIEEQAREIERLKADLDECDGGRWKLRTELAALKAQPRGVVLPKRLGECRDELADARASGWNDAIDKVARLNSSPVSAVVIDERAAFDAYFCKRHSYKPGTDTTMINSAFEPWHAWQARAALNAGSAVPDGWMPLPAAPGNGCTGSDAAEGDRPGYDALWLWFSLSRSSYAVLPRVMMHDMPDAWQAAFARLMDEWDDTWVNQPDIGSRVQIVDAEGRLVKTPDWLLNYRHPNREQLASMRAAPTAKKEG